MPKPSNAQTEKVSSEFPCLRRMPVGKLKPADYNPRTITPEALARLKKSLDHFGNLQPITFNVRSGQIIGGHQRLKCLLDLAIAETDVWCVDLDPAQEKTANLTLNASAGEWDDSRVAQMLRELQEVNVDLDLTGFTSGDIDDLLREVQSPEDFPVLDENLPIEHVCPKCGYQWSGQAS